MVWDHFENPNAMSVMIQNPTKGLAYAKREIVAARYHDVPVSAIEQAVQEHREELA